MTPTDPHGAPPPRPSAPDYDDGVARHHPGEHDELHNPDVAHEHSDVNVSAITSAAAIIGGVVLATMVLMWLLFGWFERTAVARDPQVSPVAVPPVQMPPTTIESPFFGPAAPDGVQLLTSEPMALEMHRATEQQRLHTYGWVDQGAGVARIPIAEAKKLLLERGLPTREYDLVEPQVGTRVQAAGESSAGRAIMGVVPADAEVGDEQPDTPEVPEAAPAEPAAEPQGQSHDG